jgi:hypothetical protein
MLRFPKSVTGAAAGAALFMLGIMSGHAQLGPNGSTTPSAESSRQLELLGRVLDAVRSRYVDATDDGKLIALAINGILGGLDPHSSYMDANSYSNMRATASGQFGGLGIQVNMEDGLLKVVFPIDDTPAARAGILAGDIITEVDGTPTKGLTVSQVVEKVRGAPGTEVRLEIMRKDQAALNLTLTREIMDRPVEFIRGLAIELDEPEVSDVVPFCLLAHRADLDVLGPGSDGFHEDHLQRRNGYRICQWDVREPGEAAAVSPTENPPLPPTFGGGVLAQSLCAI